MVEEKKGELATELRARAGEILAAWIVGFERSPLRFRRSAKAATYTAQVANLVETLTEAAHGGGEALQPGSDATRELERSAAFLGAQFASEGATGFDIAAVLLELRDVVAGVAPDDASALTRVFEWLTVVALDGFATAGLQSLREQTSEQLEAGTPIIEILPKVPAVLLVGAPTAPVLDNVLARAWMLAVGTGAPCLIIDCSGLAAVGERNFERGYRGFLAQAEGSALQVLLSGARRNVSELAIKLTSEAGLTIQNFEHLDRAVAHALERAGHLLMRRSER
ncbi:hypothetical protein BH11MYX1_BH11MYX1_44880 [soil metagenome]